MPFPGEILHLTLQLFDGAFDMFVRASLFDSLGNPLPGTPVGLTHVELGCYVNDTLKMPFTPEVRVVYEVFVDAGYTLHSQLHCDAVDTFKLQTLDLASDLDGTIETSETAGTVDGSDTLGGSIFGDIVIPGSIEDDVTLVGEIEDDEVASTVTGDEETTGSVEC